MSNFPHVIHVPTILHVTGEIIARDIRYEDFLRDFSGQHVEWVQGQVIKMPPVDERHDALSRFIDNLLQAYLELTGGGRVLQDPMVTRLGPDLPARQPDIQVLLPESLGRLQQNAVNGPADLIVEVVSPESERRDHVEKFSEYEQAGVREYWILDPRSRTGHFWVLTDDGLFEALRPDDDEVYQSSVLNRLSIPLDMFWRSPLPGYVETLRLVEAMLADD